MIKVPLKLSYFTEVFHTSVQGYLVTSFIESKDSLKTSPETAFGRYVHH